MRRGSRSTNTMIKDSKNSTEEKLENGMKIGSDEKAFQATSLNCVLRPRII